MTESKLKPYGDIKVKIREYEDKETGKTKGVYQKVGTLFTTPHMSRISIKLDVIPPLHTTDGWLNVYKNEEPEQAPRDNAPSETDVDKPIDLSEIPF